MNRRENVKLGYKIDFVNHRIIINDKFSKKAESTESEEFKKMMRLIADFPEFDICQRKGRIIKKCNQFKGFTYEHIRKHINAYNNSEELLDMFERVIQLSKPLNSPYKYVRDWLSAQFPDYKNSEISLNNTYKSIDVVSAPNLENYKERIYA